MLGGFASVYVAAAKVAATDVDVSLVALAEWDPAVRRRIPPAPADVVLEVSAHAHDPDSIRLDLGAR
jgi:beta-glucosidase